MFCAGDKVNCFLLSSYVFLFLLSEFKDWLIEEGTY